MDAMPNLIEHIATVEDKDKTIVAMATIKPYLKGIFGGGAHVELMLPRMDFTGDATAPQMAKDAAARLRALADELDRLSA